MLTSLYSVWNHFPFVFLQWSMFKLKYKTVPFGIRTGTHHKVKLKYLLTPPQQFRVTLLFGLYWRGVSLNLFLMRWLVISANQLVFWTRNVDKYQTVIDFLSFFRHVASSWTRSWCLYSSTCTVKRIFFCWSVLLVTGS